MREQAGKRARHRQTLTGLVADIKGSVVIKDRIEGPKQSAQNMGVTLAERILPQGAEEVLEELKASS